MDKEEKKRKLSFGTRMYIFVIATVLFAAIGVCGISYIINATQVDIYYKRLTTSSAQHFASHANVEYLRKLRSVAESEEYQAIREQAESADDDTLVVEYLKDKGLWEQYVDEREKLIEFVESMSDIKYLYVVAWGEEGSDHDMYIIDADDVPFYETGYYELREEEFNGVDPNGIIEPVISKGDWGWLCSGYVPVYDDNGNIVCHVGCDIDMEDVVAARWTNLKYAALSALLITLIALVGAIIFVNRTVVKPLNTITGEMKKFSPGPGKDYKSSSVIGIEFKTSDEIGDIGEEIKTMQKRIVDYINDITVIEKDKQKAEDDAREKGKELGEISKEAFKDALTGIGNKAAYNRKIKELNVVVGKIISDLAIVMLDVNGLKMINDNYGHTSGDLYLRGCCHVICDIFKHSPVFRIGGDEFVAILMGEDFKNRFERISEMREFFDDTYNDDKLDPWLRYSVSVGMAEFTPEDKNIETVFKRADKLMYEDKAEFKKKYGIASEIRI